jgi:hypothetical protein
MGVDVGVDVSGVGVSVGAGVGVDVAGTAVSSCGVEVGVRVGVRVGVGVDVGVVSGSVAVGRGTADPGGAGVATNDCKALSGYNSNMAVHQSNPPRFSYCQYRIPGQL